MHNFGHEDDLVIELANEVRKVLGVVNVVLNEKKLVGPTQLPHQPHVPIPSLQLHPLPEPIALDS
uniref:Uncharacterized protein n=1 Tax=Medicago truncatula TaxID=3880 RepID=I3T6Y9_MEDTR|nr:unknown [Medicago truncatula]